MSRLIKLAKKVHYPARKAWKNFKYHLQSKLMRQTGKICKVVWHSISRSNFLHRKFVALTTSHHFHRSYSSGTTHLYRPGISATSAQINGVQIKGVNVMMMNIHEKGAWKGKAEAGESSQISDTYDKWESIRRRFRGIDERADEFISKFRRDMKLEREQSIFEFEEMLKRSA